MLSGYMDKSTYTLEIFYGMKKRAGTFLTIIEQGKDRSMVCGNDSVG